MKKALSVCSIVLRIVLCVLVGVLLVYNVYMLNLYQQAVEDQQIIEYTEYITEY